MPDDTLEQLNEKLKALVENVPAYQEFLNAVQKTEEMITNLHKQDQYGRIPKLTKEDRKKLMDLHKQIGLKSEALYQAGMDRNQSQLVRKITALAAGNHRALLGYEPDKEPKSLPALLREVRTLPVDTRGAALKSKVGKQMNSRQPITFLDERGQEITGVFTPKLQENNSEKMKNGLREAARTIIDPDYKSAVENLLETMRAQPAKLGLPADATDLQLMRALGENAMYKDDTGGISPVNLGKVMSKLYPDIFPPGTDAARILGKQVMNELCDVVWEGYRTGYTYSIAGIPDGSRMDNRNAAMSAAAELLGCSGVIARSRPMTMIGPDGMEVEGTFMAEAKGFDLNNLPPEAEGIGRKALKKGEGEQVSAFTKALKSIADLQVLDYICGNIDRHEGNMLYEIDPETKKFKKVQGIDNDLAFGTIVPTGEENVNYLTVPSKMSIVTESMYNTIMKLTPEELRFSLRGFDLSEEELDAAGKRLKFLQDQLELGEKRHRQMDEDIKKNNWSNPDVLKNYDGTKEVTLIPGLIRKVSDQELSKLTFKDLSQFHPEMEDGKEKQYPDNHFGRVQRAVTQMSETYKEQETAYQSLRSDVAIGADNRADPKGQAKEQKKAMDMIRLITRRTSQGRSSPQYDAMQKAVKKYADFQMDLRVRMAVALKDKDDPDAPYDSVVSTADLEQMRKLAKDIQLSAKAYLEYKGDGHYFGYTAKRIQAAKLAYRLGEDGAKLKPAEYDLAERNEKQAVEEVNRRVGDRLKEAGWDGLEKVQRVDSKGKAEMELRFKPGQESPFGEVDMPIPAAAPSTQFGL